MKNKRSYLLVIVTLAVVTFSWAWYYGLVSVGASSARAGLRHAVNLKILPSGVSVNASGVESWTDYIFEVDISIKPSKFEALLDGRDFEASQHLMYGMQFTEAYRIPNYTGFKVSEVWYWEDTPDDAPEGGIGAICTIYTNVDRNRVFVRCSSD